MNVFLALFTYTQRKNKQQQQQNINPLKVVW